MLELPGPQHAEVSSRDVSQLGQDVQADHLSHEGHMAQVSQMTQQVSHQVVLLGQDQSLHTMQVPVTIALSSPTPRRQLTTSSKLTCSSRCPSSLCRLSSPSSPRSNS
ncbi:hypothetical protein NQZ68_031352 [Dissostichus eleginoides]|nr:hypothetical protein NQZ68_031352 [Dissostichus eleginoides]